MAVTDLATGISDLCSTHGLDTTTTTITMITMIMISIMISTMTMTMMITRTAMAKRLTRSVIGSIMDPGGEVTDQGEAAVTAMDQGVWTTTLITTGQDTSASLSTLGQATDIPLLFTHCHTRLINTTNNLRHTLPCSHTLLLPTCLPTLLKCLT